MVGAMPTAYPHSYAVLGEPAMRISQLTARLLYVWMWVVVGMLGAWVLSFWIPAPLLISGMVVGGALSAGIVFDDWF